MFMTFAAPLYLEDDKELWTEPLHRCSNSCSDEMCIEDMEKTRNKAWNQDQELTPHALASHDTETAPSTAYIQYSTSILPQGEMSMQLPYMP